MSILAVTEHKVVLITSCKIKTTSSRFIEKDKMKQLQIKMCHVNFCACQYFAIQ